MSENKPRKRKTAGRETVKKTALSALCGLAFCLVLSVAAAAMTAKSDSALSLETAAAAACVFGGAFLSAVLGAKLNGAASGSVCAGTAFTAVLVLLSLCSNDGDANPLPLFASSAAAVVLALLVSARQRPNAKKQLKKYVNR